MSHYAALNGRISENTRFLLDSDAFFEHDSGFRDQSGADFHISFTNLLARFLDYLRRYAKLGEVADLIIIQHAVINTNPQEIILPKKKAFPPKRSLSEQETLGGRIQKAREARGLSVSQAARRLGILPKTLANWEADGSEPRANQLQKLSGVLNAPSIWLIGGLDFQSYEDTEIPEVSETADLERRLKKLIKVHAETSQLLFDMQIELHRLQSKIDSADSDI